MVTLALRSKHEAIIQKPVKDTAGKCNHRVEVRKADGLSRKGAKLDTDLVRKKLEFYFREIIITLRWITVPFFTLYEE